MKEGIWFSLTPVESTRYFGYPLRKTFPPHFQFLAVELSSGTRKFEISRSASSVVARGRMPVTFSPRAPGDVSDLSLRR